MDDQSPRTVIFANGELQSPAYIQLLLEPSDRILVANGGSRHAWRLGIVPDLLIGDSDSLPDEVQRWLEAHDVQRQQFPAAKDVTDLELAIEMADRLGSSSILLLGLIGDRVDHMLTNFALLAQAATRRIPMRAMVGNQHIEAVWDEIQLRNEPSALISLVPWGGDASGVSTKGLRWNLRDETLKFDGSRGISNEFELPCVTIRVERGLLLVIHQPHAL